MIECSSLARTTQIPLPNATAPRVTIIPAKPELTAAAPRRQLRVAAYCRVSTDDEERLTSYEAQQTFYTDKIMSTPNWSMAGIFADRGITGTQARKRPEFLRMIRKCRQKKIDVILVKSISRFARNTVDCLNYVRTLRELGIAVIFEKENINTLEADSEMLITLMGAFAQAESESMSANVKWGRRQAMREGKASIQYHNLYAYERGEDGKPRIIPEQAEVVRRIFDLCLSGCSLQQIQEVLESEKIPNVSGKMEWSTGTIRGILKNEKYCGDVLMQKTYVADCISKKIVRNTGQLPMVLVENHHASIVSRDTFQAVQAELSRRSGTRAASQKTAPTGQSCYSSKYALTGNLICGECGTPYRRCVWTANGQKRPVWRCISRLDYGTKYCHESPTIDEAPLQAAILTAINSVASDRDTLAGYITDALRMELHTPTVALSLGDIDRRMQALNEEFQALFAKARQEGGYTAYSAEFRRINAEVAQLKQLQTQLMEQQKTDAVARERIHTANQALASVPVVLTEWDEAIIRQLIDTVKIVDESRILVTLKGGIEVEQELSK